jgi:hypothetical protein
MARISYNTLADDYQEGITLDRYQELMGLPLNAFNGLNNPDEINDYVCSTIWTQGHRDYLAKYLAASEEMREQELGFFIAPKYISNERHVPKSSTILNRKWFVKIGKKTDTLISSGVSLVLSTIYGVYDPVVIIVPTTVTDASEILVTYPGEKIAIHPTYVSISGGNVEIRIPRGRLVDPTLNDDREDHLDYFDDANFITSVDVYRRWYDPTYGIEIVSHIENTFTESIKAGFALVLDNRTAVVEVHQATWVAGVPSPDCAASCTDFKFMRINYLSGRQSSIKVELETARLAHTLMPYSPCACEPVQLYWLDDCNSKDYDLTPYGNKSGAINAWIADSRSKIGFGTAIGGIK